MNRETFEIHGEDEDVTAGTVNVLDDNGNPIKKTIIKSNGLREAMDRLIEYGKSKESERDPQGVPLAEEDFALISGDK